MSSSMKARFAALAIAIGVLGAAGASLAAGPAGAPYPGGVYKGSLDGRGIKLKAAAQLDSSAATGSGKLVVRCAGKLKRKVRFTTGADGGFRAKKKSPKGKTVLRARGRFVQLDAMRGKVQRARGQGCGQGRFSADLRRPDGLEKHVVTYGPYPTEPSMGNGGHEMTMRALGRRQAEARRAGTAKIGDNVVMADQPKPCEGCYLVGMVPDLVDAEGKSLNFDSGAMLHHIVFSDRTEPDATCGGRGLGERFFASGNERTPFVLPRGYGYQVDPGDNWMSVAHLMNMGGHARDLYVRVTFYTLPAGSATTDVEPFWLDIDNCGNSEYMIPAGASSESRTFEVTPQWDGEVVALGGHLHDDGVKIDAVNVSAGHELLCRSVAGYGTDPAYMGHIERMSGCTGDVGTLHAGDTLRLDSYYDSPTMQDDVMGIMVGYVAPGD